jgi:periplasmic protein CpxP/Spy
MRGSWITSAVLMLGMTLTGAALQAQQASEPAASPAPQAAASGHCTMHHHSARLQLSPEQKKQLRQLHLTARDQAAIIRNDQTLTPAQRRAKLKELRASTRQQAMAVLTPEQQNKLAEMRAERQARVAEKLGLTADQQGKLKELFRSTIQERQSVLASTTMTNDQKLAQLKEIRKNAKQQLAQILTPDQLQKFHEMRRHRMHRRHMGMRANPQG